MPPIDQEHRPDDRAPAEPTADGPGRRRWMFWGAVAIMMAMAGMWAYAFLAPQDVPGRMDSTAFPDAAEPRCAETLTTLAALPRSFDVADATERADLVDTATDELTSMVDDLEALVPETEPEQQMVTEWLADWRAYLTNRRDYAERLRTDEDARFYVDQSDRDGVQITNALDRFATVNAMASCAVPDDVG